MSFIQMILPVNGSHTGYFYNQPVRESLEQSSVDVALRFMLGQAISVNYLGRVYGGRVVDYSPTKCPIFISHYVNQLGDWMSIVVSKVNEITDEALKNYYQTFLTAISNLLSDRESGWISNANVLIEFLYREDVNDVAPIPCTKAFAIPYLKFLCKDYRSDIKADFTINHIVSVPQFFYNGNVIVEEDIPVGTQYNYSYVGTRHFVEHPHSLGEASIFTYLRGYNWATSNSNGVIGLLATYGELMLDMSNIEPLSNLRAFYDVHRLMNLKPSTSNGIQYTCAFEPILRFLVDIFFRFKIKVMDRSILANIVNHTNPDGKLLRDYLLAESKEEVSAEAYEAFKRSTLRDLVGCEIMNIIGDSYSTTSLDAAVAPQLVDAKPKQKTQPNTDPEEGDDTAEPKDPKEGEPESTSTDSADADNQKPMDQVDDNATDEEEKGVSDNKEQEDTSQKEEEPKVDESDNNKEYTHTTIVPKPKLPGLNLKKGINLELASDDEDIDTFLYRKEVECFIDNVLANPNNLSVQQQEALRNIKAQFLYTLNVQSLYQLLKKTVA